ncbi:MAG TPA: hypothetical protein VMC81_04950 [Rhodocyclaceae bacterium]|nr:hypothetical protein [Rhodocyclaceae bacterium]
MIHAHRPYARLAPALVAAALTLVLAADAGAQDKKIGQEKELARRVQLLQQEKSDLGGKLQEARTKAEELSKAVEENKRGAEKTARELSSARRSRAELTARVEKLEGEQRDLQARLDDTARQLATRENEKRMLEGVANEQVEVIGRQSRLIESYRSANTQLQQVAGEVLDKLRKATDGKADPVLGLAKVDGYNLDQSYRERLDKLRVGTQ